MAFIRKYSLLQACAVSALFSITIPAFAADMPVSAVPALEEEPFEQLSEMVSGWYLRMDAGLVITQDPDISIAMSQLVDPVKMMGVDNDQTSTIGVGFGYHFNNGFRMDLTFDYTAPVRYTADFPNSFDRTPYQQQNRTGGALYDEDYQTRKETGSVLLNAYYEMNNMGNFRPYIGAGIGIAITDIYKTYYEDPYFGNSQANSGFLFPNQNIIERGNQARHTNYTFAWALMAGMAYRLTEQFDLDVGYKYLNIGDIRSGGTNAIDMRAVLPNGAMNPNAGKYVKFDNYSRLDNVGEHQIRVGLRYNFDK